MMRCFRVHREEAGQKLVSFLAARCGEGFSAKALKRLLDAKKCLVNGQIETFSTRVLKVGDRVEIDLEAPQETDAPPILFEDRDILIIAKPSGVVSEKRAINRILSAFQGKLELVHRLDKETSGVLILAKSARAKNALEALFKEKKVEKIYHALVDGEVSQDGGTIVSRLAKKRTYQGQTIWGSTKGEGGLEAITHWKCLKRFRGISYLELRPETGRTHQLRVHLNEMGRPILGDRRYVRRFTSPFRPSRNMLHAFQIAFVHPFTGKRICVKAPDPRDFADIIKGS